MFLLGLPKIHIFHVCLVWPQVRWLLLLSSNCNIVRLSNILWWQQLFRTTSICAYRFAMTLRCFKGTSTHNLADTCDVRLFYMYYIERKRRRKKVHKLHIMNLSLKYKNLILLAICIRWRKKIHTVRPQTAIKPSKNTDSLVLVASC